MRAARSARREKGNFPNRLDSAAYPFTAPGTATAAPPSSEGLGAPLGRGAANMSGRAALGATSRKSSATVRPSFAR